VVFPSREEIENIRFEANLIESQRYYILFVRCRHRWELSRGIQGATLGVLLVLGAADPAFFHQPDTVGGFSVSRRNRKHQI